MNKNPAELSQYAMSLLAANRLEEARAAFIELSQLTPNDAQIWVVAAAISGDLGKLNEAKSFLQTAIKLEPDHEEAFLALATLANTEQDYPTALTLCERALAIDEKYPEAWLLRSAILGKLGRFEEAGNSAKRALELSPDMVDAHVNLGNSLDALGQFEAAIDAYQRALALQPDLPGAQLSLAGVLASAGQFDAAKAALERARPLNPQAPALTRLQARLDEHEGRYQLAYDLLQPLRGTDAFDAGAAITLAKASRRIGHGEQAIGILEDMVQDQTLPSLTRCQMHMVLGHLYDDRKDYDKAFANLQMGHQLNSEKFDPQAHAASMQRIVDFFDMARMQRLPSSGCESQVPVFIVGMPRSGTTLIEQILSCHAQIEGAGELKDISSIAESLFHHHNGVHKYPVYLQDTAPTKLNECANTYLERLRKVSSSAQRVVDKMPGNFMHLGFIQMLFPNARIIHAKRDQMDTCLSCYFQAFRGHSYLHDLTHLGAFYRQYERLMQHWLSVSQLPILEVQYEDLVDDTEGKSREIVEFCGMPWDENCLQFHKSDRTVMTASYQQVRRPIYKSSVQRWRNYEVHFQPLLEALGRV